MLVAGVREEEDWVKQNSKSGWIFWIQWRRGKSSYAKVFNLKFAIIGCESKAIPDVEAELDNLKNLKALLPYGDLVVWQLKLFVVSYISRAVTSDNIVDSTQRILYQKRPSTMPYHGDCLNGAKFTFIFDIISFLFQPPIFFIFFSIGNHDNAQTESVFRETFRYFTLILYVLHSLWFSYSD